MGDALAALGRDDEAAASYEQSIRFVRGRSGAHLNLAILLARRGRFDEAERHFSEVSRMMPDSMPARRCLENLRDGSPRREGWR